MILENKFIRIKRQRQRLITIILIIFFLLFFAAVVLFSNTNTDTQFKIDDTLILSGILISDNNYPLYTHSLVTPDANIYLKSSTINLNQLVDQHITLWGKVIDTSNKTPIVDISVVQGLDNSYILKNKTYIFPHNFFLLDTAQDANISVVQDNNDIQAYYAGNLAFEVHSFLCNKVIPDQDCDGIRKKLVDKYVKTFTSPHGYQFYQSSDTLRYVLDKKLPLAYVFTAANEDDIINLSYIFRPIDGKFIADSSSDLIASSCLDKKDTLIAVDDIVKQNIKGDKFIQLELKVKAEQTNDNDKMVPIIKECTLLIDVFDILLRSKVDFK